MSSPRILCLGHAAHDVIYRVTAVPSRPSKVVAHDVYECGGGMAANAAVAISRLGGRPSYWGRVADDPLGARILAELAHEGVDVATARKVPGARSAPTAILIGEDGERLICSFPNPALDRDATWLPVAGIAEFAAVLTDVRWPEGAALVLDAARAARRPAVLDADVGDPEQVLRLMACADIVAFSEPGLAAVAGPGTPGEQLARMAVTTPATVGVTLGEAGFLWREGGRERRAPAPVVTSVDTLAAGDVWHGAFTLRLAEGSDLETAAAFANVAAALKCTRPGGRSGAPTRAEVEQYDTR